MRLRLGPWSVHWLCIPAVLALVGLIYLERSYSYYSRVVDQTIVTGAFADTIDIYASKKDEAQYITNLSHENREKRRLVHFDELPTTLVQAVLSAEDKRFFSHHGLDFPRIAKAAYLNTLAGRKEQGASTITMQLARSLWLERNKTWGRKWAEVLMTIRLERKLSKVEIFELYANQVDLSHYGTFNIHGFGEAAWLFFGKEIEDLTLPESATLAGLIQRPSYFSPSRYPERSLLRRNSVLQLMRRNDYLNDAQLKAALQAPLKTVPLPDVDDSQAPYFLDLMKKELKTKLPQSADSRYRVNTTLDVTLQHEALAAVRLGIKEAERRLPRELREQGGTLQVALVALDPHTGEVKALVGGRDYRDSQLNHAIAQRQPGSLFKPFVYAAALQSTLASGEQLLTPATILTDEPTLFWFDRKAYEPHNFGGAFHGQVSLRTALAKSVNIISVQLAQIVGYPAIVSVAKGAGLTRAAPTPSVALGSYESTPLEMAGAYTIFANNGIYVEPHLISTVEDQEGTTIYNSSPTRRPVLDPRVTYQMVNLLQEVLQTGTGAGVRSRGLVVPAAGKTGTSRDGWFAGFISDLLCIVWVGFDDHRDLKVEGAKSALPIWTEFMKRAVQHGVAAKPFRAPPGIVAVEIDPESGQLATSYCESSRVEFFVRGTEPQEDCSLHSPDQFFSGSPTLENGSYGNSPHPVGSAIEANHR
jgi:penicillin-binding protein 1B